MATPFVSPMPMGLGMGPRRRRFSPLAASLAGTSNAFQPTAAPAALPQNYGFGDLADFEEQRRTQFGNQARQDILGLGQTVGTMGADLRKNLQGQFDTALTDQTQRNTQRRADLSKSLLDIGQQQFTMQNPMILEDLQRRGFSSSPTETANAQAQALKEIALGNQRQLLDFDTRAFAGEDQLLGQRLSELTGTDKDLFGRQVDIQGNALSAQLQGQQDALDAGMDLRRGGLEAQIAEANAAREEALARDLARQQKRAGITQSLIGAGGGILGGALAGGGGFGGLFGGGAKAVAGRTVMQTNPITGAIESIPVSGGAGGGGGAMGVLGPAALGTGAVLAANNFYGKRANFSKKEKDLAKLGPIAGTLAVAKGAGKAIEKTGISGQNITGGSIGKAIKKLCFDGETLVEMADRTRKKIKDVRPGEATRGGIAFKVSASITDPGTRFNYLGIIVTGSHAVKEHGRWKRVEDADYSVPISGGGLVYSLGTEDHRIYANGVIFADELEHDDYEELTMAESLERLNAQEVLEVR